MQTQPDAAHEWLQQLVGEWTFESEACMAPDQPPHTFRGKEVVRSLSGLWVICEAQGALPDSGTSTSIITLGYDPAKKKYVGTFVSSMMPMMWVYEGELDSTGKSLILDTEGPSFFSDGKTTSYKDTIEIQSRDQRVLSSQSLDEEGKWQGFMTMQYQRTK